MSMQNHSVPELLNKMSKCLSYTTAFKLQVVDFVETNGNQPDASALMKVTSIMQSNFVFNSYFIEINLLVQVILT